MVYSRAWRTPTSSLGNKSVGWTLNFLIIRTVWVDLVQWLRRYAHGRNATAVQIKVGASCNERLVWQHQPNRETERLHLSTRCQSATSLSLPVEEVDSSSSCTFILHLIGRLTMTANFQADAHRTGRATWNAFLALVIAD